MNWSDQGLTCAGENFPMNIPIKGDSRFWGLVARLVNFTQ